MGVYKERSDIHQLDKPRAEIRERLPRALEQNLSLGEIEVLKGVEEVADLTDPIFQDQKDQERLPFYPKGMTEEQIRALGKTIPDVVSPHAYVSEEPTEVRVEFFHEKFQGRVEAIADKLEKTADSIPDGDYRSGWLYGERLKMLAKAFRTDDWRSYDINGRFNLPWINRVEFVIGPIETSRIDPFGIKASYQAVVGVIDESATQRIDSLKNAAISLFRRTTTAPRIDLKVMHVTAATGITNPSTGEPWKAQMSPNDPELKEELGSRGLIYQNLLEKHFETRLYRIMRSVFDGGLLQKFSKEQLMVAYQQWIALHEIQHSLTRTVGQDKRQGSLFAAFHELHCDIAGLSAAYRLTLTGNYLNSDEFEAILMIHLARKLNDIYGYHFSDKKFPDPYAQGARVELNYLVRSAGLAPSSKNKLGLEQERQIVASISNLLGRFNMDAQDTTFEQTQEFFSRFESGEGYIFAEPLLRDLFKDPDPSFNSD